jgi:hypothetical protein
MTMDKVTFVKWNLNHNDFEAYAIHYEGFHVARFLNDDRDNYNSVLTLEDKDFNAVILIEILEAIKEKFGLKTFKTLSK